MQTQLLRSGATDDVALRGHVVTGEGLTVGGDWCWG